MFEDRTYENLMAEVLAAAPTGIDTRQGSIFYDAVSGAMLKIAKLYTDIDLVFELVFLDSATGDYLDKRAEEHGLSRNGATYSKYLAVFEGATPEAGERFFADGYYFVLALDDNGDDLLFIAEDAGSNTKDISPGTSAVPVNNINGLTASAFGEIVQSGADEEDDSSLRSRLKEKISGPDENGNRQHYKTWCEEVAGVGRARIFPLWNGENTVKGVILDADGLPAASGLVEQVQTYIDPNASGTTITVGEITYNVGDGLGEGVANLGAHFTAVAAAALFVDVAFVAELVEGADAAAAKEEAEEAITEYLKDLALNTNEGETVVIRLSAIGTKIAAIATLLDYTDLTLNGSASNITLADDEVGVLGEVTVSVTV